MNEDNVFEKLEKATKISITQEDLKKIDVSSVRSCLIGLLDYQKTLYSERDGALDDFNDETAACGVPYPSYEDVFSDSIRSVSEPFKEFLKTFAKDLKISAKDIAVILKKEIQGALNDETQSRLDVEKSYAQVQEEVNEFQIGQFSDLYSLDNALVQLNIILSNNVVCFTEEQIECLKKIIQSNDVAKERLTYIATNNLFESFSNFEDLEMHLMKPEKKNLLNI